MGGWSRVGWGVITHACEGKASEGNNSEGLEDAAISAGGPSLHSDTDLTASMSAAAHASQPPPQVPSSPHAWTIGRASVGVWKWRPPWSPQPS